MTVGPPSSGACPACGAPASLRCSACATGSSIDILFCSHAHQKEVWPTHKLVCGRRVHPFKLPPFCQKEADFVAWQCTKQTESLGKAASQLRLQKALSNMVSLSVAEYTNMCDHFVGRGDTYIVLRDPPPSLEDNDDAFTTFRRDFTIYVVRHISLEMHLPTEARNDLLDLPLVLSMPYFYETYTRKIPLDGSAKWHSELCHRLLVLQHYSAQMRLAMKIRPVNKAELSRTTKDLVRSYEALKVFVQTVPNRDLVPAATRQIDMMLMPLSAIF